MDVLHVEGPGVIGVEALAADFALELPVLAAERGRLRLRADGFWAERCRGLTGTAGTAGAEGAMADLTFKCPP
eukprot:CAMPEP_0115104120 /NCGR_PEP_ID=MMETSP0227-20121206/35077_1 /TAXON_ID=89957 /ORGANISM="Polarella glacialis, Strain CCMP 1383" /LENGTH=72 /DNA_ID=CAMNT_0002500879 /DNA_START=81 /DNA_END=297 /DNA_ORIENTATION=+